MAVYETTRGNVAGLNLGGRISYFLNKMFADLADWNAKRQTKNALLKLSSRELDDIGLSRSDLANF